MWQFIKDSWEETFIGFILGLGFFLAIGWWAILLGIATGILWKLGGLGFLQTKLWRRLGCPLAILIALNHYTWATGLAVLASWGILSLGYGSRSTQPYDHGTWLGNFWQNLLGERWGKCAARLTILISIWITWGATWILSTK